MPRPSLLALAGALALLAPAAAVAVAQPAGPVAGKPYLPRSIAVTSASGPLARHVEAAEAGLRGCAMGERARVIRGGVNVRWNAAGKLLSVRVLGGSRRFDRCAERALAGRIDGVARRGSAIARFELDREPTPAPYLPPGDPSAPGRVPPVTSPPVTPVGGGLDICKVDTDCTVYFRISSCFPGDPMAVNAGQLAAVRVKYPVHREECAMGGPQYERQRMQNEGRYSASCEAKRCVLHDAGLRRTPLDL